MYNREIFWKFVEIGLAQAKLTPAKAIQAYRRVWRNEIDNFIGGFEPTDMKALAEKAAEYVAYVQGGPMPAWFVPFASNWPE